MISSRWWNKKQNNLVPDSSALWVQDSSSDAKKNEKNGNRQKAQSCEIAFLTFDREYFFPLVETSNRNVEDGTWHGTYPSALEELILSGLNVLLLATPGSQHGSLQSAAVRECQSPWSSWLVVDGVQVDGRFFLWLTAGQEGDSWNEIAQRLVHRPKT